MNFHPINHPSQAAQSKLRPSQRHPQPILRKSLLLFAVSLLSSLFILAAVPASSPNPAPTLAYDEAAVVGDTQTSPDDEKIITTILYQASSPTVTITPISSTTAAPTLIYDFVSVVDIAPTPLKPAAVPTPEPTPEPSPEQTPKPTPAPTPAPTPMPASHYKQQLLDLINQARSEAGLDPVTLAENPLPQQQADSALENCLFSNWGLDGLKPYMRMSLAGDYQANGEIVAAYGACTPSETTRWADGDSVVLDVIARWRTSRLDWQNNVLDPWYSKVSVGMAWNDHFYAVHLHFERDYVEFNTLPSISADGILSIDGSLGNGVSSPTRSDLLVDVYYDPPPRSLTPGQLSATNCYVYGETGFLVAALRPPPPPDHNYPDETLTIDYVLGCANPYDVSVDTPAPTGFLETPSVSLSMHEGVADWVTARNWNVADDSFSVAADLTSVIEKHGNGVYTILIWAVADSGDDVLVGTYSIFVGIPPPTQNDPS